MAKSTVQNRATGEYIDVDADQVDDQLAQQLIKQDETTQMVYREERRAGASIWEAINRAEIAYLGTPHRR